MKVDTGAACEGKRSVLDRWSPGAWGTSRDQSLGIHLLAKH